MRADDFYYFDVQVWVGLFGLVAAAASWRSGWKATALPPPPLENMMPPPSPRPTTDELVSEKAASEADVTDEDISKPLDVHAYDT